MKVCKRILMCLLLVCFSFMMCFNSFAVSVPALFSDRYECFYTHINFSGSAKSSSTLFGFSGDAKVYWYRSEPQDPYNTVKMVFLSEKPFTVYGKQVSLIGDKYPPIPDSPDAFSYESSSSGKYYMYSGIDVSSALPSKFSLPGAIVVGGTWRSFWLDEGFVLGQGGSSSGGDSSSIIYDSTIPAPENLQYKQVSKGFDFMTGAKFEHQLTWTNGAATPPVYVRVSAVAEILFNDTGQAIPDSMIHLLPASANGVNATIGKFTASAEDFKAKVLQGTTLHKVLDYRVQFYRYGEDEKLNVGPISTIHLNYNVLGKYTGYTVTTDKPKDDTNLGITGGMDDFYQDNWTSDGEDYNEYDKDGNLTDTGKTEEGNFFDKLLNSLASIPKIINSFFDSLLALMSGVGQIPTYLAQLFSFLPIEIISLIGTGVLVVVWLRILGR